MPWSPSACAAPWRRLSNAARVLQDRQRRKLEARKPQWPWRLTIMAARAQKRARDAALAGGTPVRRALDPTAALAPDGLKVLQRLAGGAESAASKRAWDPRGGS